MRFPSAVHFTAFKPIFYKPRYVGTNLQEFRQTSYILLPIYSDFLRARGLGDAALVDAVHVLRGLALRSAARGALLGGKQFSRHQCAQTAKNQLNRKNSMSASDSSIAAVSKRNLARKIFVFSSLNTTSQN